jgi:hypothetical protein
VYDGPKVFQAAEPELKPVNPSSKLSAQDAVVLLRAR